MAGAHCVYVEPLHDLYVLHHALHAYHVAPVGVHLVAVDALYEYRPAVDEQLPTADFYVAESYLLRHSLDGGTSALQLNAESIEIRRLGCPWLRPGHGHRAAHLAALYSPLRAAHHAPTGIFEAQRERSALASFNGNGVCEQAVAVAVDEVLADGDVGNAHFRPGVQVNLAGYAGKPPEVLVFKVRAVTPAHHLHCDEVAPRLEVFGDVELGSHLAVFAVTDVASVDPEHEVARGRAYVEVHLAALPAAGQAERAAVGAYVVFRKAHKRRVALERGVPGIAHVLVRGVAVAVEFKKARHGDFGPGRVVVVGLEESFGPVGVVAPEVELPHPLHRKVAGRLPFLPLQGQGQALVGKEVGTPRLAVLLVHGWVLPHGGRSLGHDCGQGCGQR